MADPVRTRHLCSSANIVEFSGNISLVTMSLNGRKNTHVMTVPRGITFSVFFTGHIFKPSLCFAASSERCQT